MAIRLYTASCRGRAGSNRSGDLLSVGWAGDRRVGFWRLELSSFGKAQRGEYRCPASGALLEKLDGDMLVTYRLTIQPSIKDARD